MKMNGLLTDNPGKTAFEGVSLEGLDGIIESTERQLFERFGPLLTLQQTAELFHRTPDGLRVSLNRNTRFSNALNAAKRRIGRRIYFRASMLARLIEEGMV